MRRRFRLIPLLALMALPACAEDPVSACTDEGPRWEVARDPLEIAVGQTVAVEVVEVSCSGRSRARVYPPLMSQDPAIVTASGLRQTVTGIAAGTATIVIEADPAVTRGDIEFDVVVR